MPIDTLTHTLNVAKTANWGDFEVMYDRIRVWLKRQCLRIASTKWLCVQRRQKQCIAFHLISLVVTVTWPARDFRPDRAIERSIGVGQVRRVVAYWNFFYDKQRCCSSSGTDKFALGQLSAGASRRQSTPFLVNQSISHFICKIKQKQIK